MHVSGDDYLVFIIWDGSVLGLWERAFSEIMEVDGFGDGELTSLPGVFYLFKGLIKLCFFLSTSYRFSTLQS